MFATSYFVYDTWAMYQVYATDESKIKDKPRFISRLVGFIKEEPSMMLHHAVVVFIYGPVIVVRT